MRPALAIALMLFVMSAAHAHSYRIGNLEIVHPAIMVPQANSDCTCAHVTIINHGPDTEYFLGADIAIASSRRLLYVASHDHDISAPSACRLRQAPRSICIAMSGACFSATFIQA
jgi:copper(I)-binding protein